MIACTSSSFVKHSENVHDRQHMLTIRLRVTMSADSDDIGLQREQQRPATQADHLNTACDDAIMREAIIHTIAHELRTPLLQVKAAISLLAEEGQDANSIIHLAQSAVWRLESSVRNVTLLSELTREGRDTKALSLTMPIYLLQGAQRHLSKSWEYRDQLRRLRVQCPSNPWPILCEPARISIALQLLLENALKFSDGPVDISVRQDINTNSVTVNISDTGIGIPPELHQRVFEPFFQADNSTTRRYGGIGIGLTIVQRILKQHGAEIRVESVPGQGSTFSFMLPIVQTSAEPIKAETRTARKR